MRQRFVYALLALALLVSLTAFAGSSPAAPEAAPEAAPTEAPSAEAAPAEASLPETAPLPELADPQEPILRTCAGDCFRTYRTCYQNCIADPFCESQCKQEYDACRAACP